MNVLMISGDRNLLKEGTEAYARLQLQRTVVDRLDVFVWPQVHSLREIFQSAKTNHYDVVTAQDPFWRGHLAWHLAKRNKAKLNIQVHTDFNAQPQWRRFWGRLQLRRADSVRVVSERIKKQIEGFVHSPISVLPIFVDTAPFRGLQHTSHPRFKKTILWIGRFEPEKDPFRAIALLADVRASGVDAGLIMLGSGSLEQELRSKAQDFPAHVEFPGWQNPRQYLQMADVVVSTSKHESYGASILEALAAGVPVVAPDVGIAKEAGAIVVPRTELSAAVLTVLKEGTRDELKLALPSKEEWIKRWKESFL